VRLYKIDRNFACFGPPIFFFLGGGGEPPEFLDLRYKIEVAKFRGDRPKDLGDYALEKPRRRYNEDVSNVNRKAFRVCVHDLWGWLYSISEPRRVASCTLSEYLSGFLNRSQMEWERRHKPDLQWRSSSFQESKKVRVSRDLWPLTLTVTLRTPCMQAYLVTIVCKFGGDRAICLREEAICAKVYRQTNRRTDGRLAIVLAHSWNELKTDACW